MWILGHLGIGEKLAAPFSRRLPLRWILFGTLLPDLIDKPLYYGAVLFTGRHGAEIGLISCTRTFGHTALFLFALSFIAYARKSKIFAALTIGVATHLVLDGFQDYWFQNVMHLGGESSLRIAALYPFLQSHFADMPYPNLLDHLKSVDRPFTLIAEGIGAAILGWDYWKKKWKFKQLLRIGLPWRKPRGARSSGGSSSGKTRDSSSRT
jgi:hypothetical protein